MLSFDKHKMFLSNDNLPHSNNNSFLIQATYAESMMTKSHTKAKSLTEFNKSPIIEHMAFVSV